MLWKTIRRYQAMHQRTRFDTSIITASKLTLQQENEQTVTLDLDNER